MDRRPEHDSELPAIVLKSNLFDMRGIDERLKVDNLWMVGIASLFSKQKGRCAVGTDRITNYGFEGVVNVVASRANLNCRHQCLTTRVRPDKIGGPLHRGKRACTSEAGDRCSLHVVLEIRTAD